MVRQKIIRAFFFAFFFAAGSAAVATAILCDELAGYWRAKGVLVDERVFTEKLESLDADYDALLGQIESDPNLLRYIAPATLGTELAEPDTAYPQATAEQLAEVRQALAAEAKQPVGSTTPRWLQRCLEPRRKAVLFMAGAFLIIISFICFGTVRPASEDEGAEH